MNDRSNERPKSGGDKIRKDNRHLPPSKLTLPMPPVKPAKEEPAPREEKK